ncbi:MAG: hypothetical protein KGM43_19630, partial [Planctomycetota bacterium]|nr:hypothetical protein [Planctomycetota bacterium]
MESRALAVVVPRVFRTGETPRLEVTTRNLEKLTFSAYKLDPETYFRKKRTLDGVAALDVGLVAPDVEWSIDVPKYQKYATIKSDYMLTKLDVPGVYVMKVSDEKHLRATTLVIGSDVDAIFKASQDQLLVFAQDMKSRRGRAGARVIACDDASIVFEGTTGEDGVLLKDWPSRRTPGSRLHYLVVDGKHVAASDLLLQNQSSQGLSPRAYIETDRPAYRPGQSVSIRGVVREARDGRYIDNPGATYRLEVFDARGRRIVAKPVVLSAFGSFEATVALEDAAPLGAYRVRVFQPGKSDFAGMFLVDAYRLEPIDLAFDLKRRVYFRGETIEADVVGKYQYGAPLASRPIVVDLPDGRILHGMTDASGRYRVTLSTDGFAEEQTLRLVAQLPQDNVSAAALVSIAARAFEIELTSKRDVYLDGESFTLEASTREPAGDPTGQKLEVAVLKRIEKNGIVSEREVARKPLATDAKTGRGEVVLRVDDERGGAYVIRARGVDRFGNPVMSERVVQISGRDDPETLRILSDVTSFKVGVEAKVNLHNRAKAGTALVCWEADRILKYKIVAINEGDNALSWPVEVDQFPNFTLTAARMRGAGFDKGEIDLHIERDLKVVVSPRKPAVGPGDEIEIDVETRDQLNRPVSAELSLAMVDRALLRLFQDRLPAIEEYFYNQTRVGAFATVATNGYSDKAHTQPVEDALVDEDERAAAERGDLADLDLKRNQAATLAAAPMAQPGSESMKRESGNRPAAGAMMGGMGRGMGFGMAGQNGRRKGTGTSMEIGLTAADRSFDSMQSNRGYLENDKAGAAQSSPEVQLRDAGGVMTKSRTAPALRQRFAETAYWNPRVVTGADGKTVVRFRAPGSISEYRLMARGVSASDTLVGQSTSSVTVRKSFFVDLRLPSTLTQGDSMRLSARVHHIGVVGPIALRLKLYAGGREQVYPKTIEVKGDGVADVMFDAFEVPEGDVVRASLSAAAGDRFDEIVVEAPIRPWGVEVYANVSGSSRDDASVAVELPEGRAYEQAEMSIVISPSIRWMLIAEALGDRFPLPLLKGDRHARPYIPIPRPTIA